MSRRLVLALPALCVFEAVLQKFLFLGGGADSGVLANDAGNGCGSGAHILERSSGKVFETPGMCTAKPIE